LGSGGQLVAQNWLSKQHPRLPSSYLIMIRIFRGAPYGSPILTVQRNLVFEGSSVSGAPLYTINGTHLFAGSAISGSPLATLSGARVFRGFSSSGSPLGSISGDHAFEGSNVSGSILVSASEANPHALLAGIFHESR